MMTSRRSCQQKCTVKHIYAGLALESSLGGYPFEKIIPTPILFQSTDFKVPLSGLLPDGLAPFGPDRLVECPHLRSGSGHAVVPVALAGCTCSTTRYVLPTQRRLLCGGAMVHHVIYVTQAEAHGEIGSLLGPVGTNPPFRRPANPGVTTLSRLPLAQTGLSPPSKAWNSVEASVLKRHSGPWM
jgi:hypothetical protein